MNVILEERKKSEKQGNAYILLPNLIERCAKDPKSPLPDELRNKIARLVEEKQLAQEGPNLSFPNKEARGHGRSRSGQASSQKSTAPVKLPDHLTVGGITLTKEQRCAVSLASSNRLSLILGGAGTGKTTLIRAIIQNHPREKGPILLCVPTGKAAVNLSDRTGRRVSTLHSVFELPFLDGQKLYYDLVVVDEASLMSLKMLTWLLTILGPDCRIVLVGDPNQLPSVSCGNVINDLLKLRIPSIRLKTFHRQADIESALARNIRNFDQCYKMGDFSFDDSFSFISRKDNRTIQHVCQYAAERYCEKQDIQVLSPRARNCVLCVDDLNDQLQKMLLPSKEMELYPLKDGARIQVITNDRNQDVFNGQTGTLHLLRRGEDEPWYQFTCGKREAVYDANDVMSHPVSGLCHQRS